MVQQGSGCHLLADTRCKKSPRAQCSRGRGARRVQADRRGPKRREEARVGAGRGARVGPRGAPSAAGARRLQRAHLAPGRDRRHAGGSAGPALPRGAGTCTASTWRLRWLFRVEKRAGARPTSRRGTRGAGQGWLGGASRVPGGTGRSRRSVVGRSAGLCFGYEGVYGPGFLAQNSAKAKATTIICLLLEVLE